MDGVGLGGFCQNIEHIDVDELIGKVAKLQENIRASSFKSQEKRLPRGVRRAV